MEVSIVQIPLHKRQTTTLLVIIQATGPTQQTAYRPTPPGAPPEALETRMLQQIRRHRTRHTTQVIMVQIPPTHKIIHRRMLRFPEFKQIQLATMLVTIRARVQLVPMVAQPRQIPHSIRILPLEVQTILMLGQTRTQVQTIIRITAVAVAQTINRIQPAILLSGVTMSIMPAVP